jgi:hypothetical protein
VFENLIILILTNKKKGIYYGRNYVLTQKGNPGDTSAPKKFYAQAKASKEFTFGKLSKEIAEGSTTVSDTDVLAVLNDLVLPVPVQKPNQSTTRQ